MFPKERPGRLLLSLVLLCVAAISLLGPVHSAPADDAPSPPPLAPSARSEVLVILKEQADLGRAVELGSKAEKGWFVYRQLTETAERTQQALRAHLDRQGISCQAYWIRNMVRVTADADLVRDLAGRPEVARVEVLRPDELEPILEGEPVPLGEPASVGWNLQRVGADDVWALGITGDGVVVGVIDSGADWDHPALINTYRPWVPGAPTRHDYNWYDGPGGSPIPADSSGHGTIVTGVVVGDDGAGNQIGMAPAADWIACRMTGGTAVALDCLQFMLAPTKLDGSDPRPDLAPHVLSNSWRAATDYSDIIRTLYLAGIMFVKAGENEGTDCGTVHVPGELREVMAVGAFEQGDIITSFSSRGPMLLDGQLIIKPDLTAPGLDVWTSAPGGGYTSGRGTSVACPHVAGAAALILSARPDLAGNIETLQKLLRQTAEPRIDLQCPPNDPSGVPNNVWGYGILNVYDAVLAAQSLALGVAGGQISDSDTAQPIDSVELVFEDPAAGGPLRAWTTATGVYTLTLPAATYTVTASTYGYAPQTVSGLVVLPGQATTQDLSLDLLPTYVLSGTVSQARTGIALSATLSVLHTPLAPVQTDPATGFYSLTVASGTHILRVESQQHRVLERALVVDGDTELDLGLPPIPFIPYEGNPVIEPGPPGSWDARILAGSSLIYRDGVITLFYVADNGIDNAGAIGYATSTNGMEFAKFAGNPILAGDGSGFDAHWAAYPAALIINGQWVIYYAGWASGGSIQIGRAYADEPSGPWYRSYSPVLSPGSYWEWDAERVYPDTVLDTGNGYVMYYSGDGYPGISNKIGRATSSNSFVWTKYDDPDTVSSPYAESDPVFKPGAPDTWDHRSIVHSNVVQTDTGWEMFYTGFSPILNSAIGAATSPDGINWARSGSSAILRLADDPLSSDWIQSPAVIEIEGTRWMYHDYGYGGIGLAIEPPCLAVGDAAFLWEPLEPTVGETVTFASEATGTLPITYTWDLGDGTRAEGPVVTHEYATSDIYTVELTATNDCNTQVVSGTLEVIPSCVPVSGTEMGWEPITPSVGQTVTFTAEATGTLPITFGWDFGDGTHGEGSVATHQYALSGNYVVELTATNECDEQVVQGALEVTPACEPVSGTAMIWEPVMPTAGQTVTFTAQATGTLPITFTWDFGDGGRGEGPRVNHTYEVSSTYPVVLTSTNGCDVEQVVDGLITVQEAEDGPHRIYLPLVLSAGP